MRGRFPKDNRPESNPPRCFAPVCPSCKQAAGLRAHTCDWCRKWREEDDWNRAAVADWYAEKARERLFGRLRIPYTPRSGDGYTTAGDGGVSQSAPRRRRPPPDLNLWAPWGGLEESGSGRWGSFSFWALRYGGFDAESAIFEEAL